MQTDPVLRWEDLSSPPFQREDARTEWNVTTRQSCDASLRLDRLASATNTKGATPSVDLTISCPNRNDVFVKNESRLYRSSIDNSFHSIVGGNTTAVLWCKTSRFNGMAQRKGTTILNPKSTFSSSGTHGFPIPALGLSAWPSDWTVAHTRVKPHGCIKPRQELSSRTHSQQVASRDCC